MLRDLIGKPRGPHLWDGFAARGQNQIFGVHGHGLALAAQRNLKAARVVPGNRPDLGLQPKVSARAAQFGQKHVDDGLRPAIAKQLAKSFLMPGDVVPIHEIDEIPLRVAGQCTLCEMRIGAQEILGRGVDIGEVAAPSA